MNMPRAEFLSGMLPTEEITPPSNWTNRFAGKIVIFESDWRFDGEANILHLIKDWRRMQGLHATAGFCHEVTFPDCPTVSVMAWTPFLAFQHRVPNNKNLAPKRLVYFTQGKDLLRWKRATWESRGHSAKTSYMVHSSCYTPTGEWLRRDYLFTFNG